MTFLIKILCDINNNVYLGELYGMVSVFAS